MKLIRLGDFRPYIRKLFQASYVSQKFFENPIGIPGLVFGEKKVVDHPQEPKGDGEEQARNTKHNISKFSLSYPIFF